LMDQHFQFDHQILKDLIINHLSILNHINLNLIYISIKIILLATIASRPQTTILNCR
jgi:hypothetical protein